MPRQILDLEPMVTLTARVPATLAELVRADAAADDRLPSQVIRRILVRHYAGQAAS